MKVSKFNQIICSKEGGEKQVDIAQVSEIIKIANDITGGIIYTVIDILRDCECEGKELE